MSEAYLVVALPSKRAIEHGATWERMVSGPFDKATALHYAKEHRERKVYGRIFLERQDGQQ